MTCPNCGADALHVWVDDGIGQYEFWGQRCVDSHKSFVCSECGEPLDVEYSYTDYVSEMKAEARERD